MDKIAAPFIQSYIRIQGYANKTQNGNISKMTLNIIQRQTVLIYTIVL